MGDATVISKLADYRPSVHEPRTFVTTGIPHHPVLRSCTSQDQDGHVYYLFETVVICGVASSMLSMLYEAL